jgi:SAM-dependent methyltransferase
MNGTIIARLMTFLSEAVLFPSLSARKKLAFRYLHGTGLEIGALQHPLETPPGVTVRYVDYVTRDENILRYPHLDESRIVSTDLIDDGFELATIHDDSQDFVIANHLLEHAPNPLQTLLNWHRVLKKSGILFITLPNGTRNFDQGRRITPLEHIVEDYELVKKGDLEQFAQNNREHYREFVEISLPNLNRMRQRRPMTEERKQEYLEKLVAEQSTDAHFHLFTRKSMKQLCAHLIAGYAGDLSLMETVRSRFGQEYVLILQKEDQ